MSYARTEIAGRLRWKFKPDMAQGGCVKEAIRKAAHHLKISWHRARDLMRAKAKPTVEEMDLVRSITPDFPHSQIAKADPHVEAKQILASTIAEVEANLAKVRALLDRPAGR